MKSCNRSVVATHRTAATGVAVFLSILAAPAMAYVGPGAGLTMIGALWAVLVAVVFVIGGLLIWPLRAVLRRGKARRDPTPDAHAADGAAPEETASAEPVHKARAGND